MIRRPRQFQNLPEWVQDIYPHQLQAVDNIMLAFEDVDVVILEAPTGSGKTLIAELVRRQLQVQNTTYICNDKKLQDQFVRDFPYAKVLKGRVNYKTELDQEKSCDECMIVNPGDSCWYCDSKGSCPYEVAKLDAIKAELAVVNTSYFLTETNFVGGFGKRDFIVVDEADTMESIMSGFVEFRIGPYLLKTLGIKAPPKGTRKPKLIEWLRLFIDTGTLWLNKQSKLMDPHDMRRFKRMFNEAATVYLELQDELDQGGTEDEESKEGGWLRIYEDREERAPDEEKQLVLKPVKVDRYGTRYLWRHGDKFLLMSASIISAEELADSLGLDREWRLVSVPMTFPKENRPIIVAPVADVTYTKREVELVKLVHAIDQICKTHDQERILIHTVSYWLTNALTRELKKRNAGRLFVTYESSAGSATALAKYQNSPNAVLLAPSMDRGVDLKDDLCGVVVIAKVPWPSLSDRTVSARLHLPGGSAWYAVQTIRSVVQMTGRGVRHQEDYAISYILDKQFATNLWRNEKLFPSWWKEAVRNRDDIRWLYLSAN